MLVYIYDSLVMPNMGTFVDLCKPDISVDLIHVIVNCTYYMTYLHVV